VAADNSRPLAQGGPIGAVIFDFDGVIVESNDVKTAAFGELFSRFPEHAESMMKFHHEHVSASRFAKFDQLLKLLGREQDLALRDELAREFSRLSIERVVAVPYVRGALDLLQALQGKLPLYLASVTPADDLLRIIERRQLRHYFKGIYGCPPWNKADAVADILKIEGLSPQQVVLVGDSAGDQRAAEQNGVGFVARNSGLPFAAPPLHEFSDLTGIRTFIEERLS
jgi:phosphoglycolate phosphatase-like HAD superfamily hydrolase